MMKELFNVSKIRFCTLLLFLPLIIACFTQKPNQEMIEDFTITEIAQAVLDAQDFVQLGDNLSELDNLDLASLKTIITKAMNVDKFFESSINPSNLILALYKTYISPKSSSQALIITAYTEAIEKSHNLGYFRIDISGYKTLSKQQQANKDNEADI